MLVGYKTKMVPTGVQINIIVFIGSCLNVVFGINKQFEPEVWLGGCNQFGLEAHKLTYFTFPKNLSSQPTFKNNCIIKMENNYICHGDTERVMFLCQAGYPIVWKYSALQTISTEYSTSSNFNQSENQFVPTVFRGILSIQCQDSLGANFTCTSTELATKLSSSIYVTSRGRKLQFEDKHIEIPATNSLKNTTVDFLVLPCRPLNITEKVVLEKAIPSKNNNTSDTYKLSSFTTAQMTFDPTIGFKISTSKIPLPSLLGIYKCSVMKTNHSVYFNVTNEVKREESFKEVYQAHATTFKFKRNYKAAHGPTEDVICCSGVKGRPPFLENPPCSSPEDCNIVKGIALNLLESYEKKQTPENFEKKFNESISDCTTRQMFAVAHVVICKGLSLDVKDVFVQGFHTLSNAPIQARSRWILNHDDVTDTGKEFVPLISRYVRSSTADKLEIQQKVFIVIASKNEFIWGHKYMSRESIGFDTDYDQFFKRQLLNQNATTYVENKEAQPSLVEIDRYAYFAGEQLSVLCFGTKLFHNNGAKLTIIWRNGSTNDLEIDNTFGDKGLQKVFLTGNGVIFNREGDRSISVVSEVINATEDIAAVKCWMPKYVSSKWDTLVKKILVKKPRFMERMKEIVDLTWDSKGYSTSCTIDEWMPKADILVSWNNKPLEIEWMRTKAEFEAEKLPKLANGVKVLGFRSTSEKRINLRIEFFGALADCSGLYICNAYNGHINVSRTVVLIIKGKPGKWNYIWLLFGITVLIFVFIRLVRNAKSRNSGPM